MSCFSARRACRGRRVKFAAGGGGDGDRIGGEWVAYSYLFVIVVDYHLRFSPFLLWDIGDFVGADKDLFWRRVWFSDPFE